jgi:molybdenum cofactor guanylyltransferase
MSTSRHLTGFVLAGGKSTRMGQDKALLDWKGQTLLDHMVNLVSAVADPVHVVGRGSLPDRVQGLGPLSGIATALETSATDANLVVAVDLPLLTTGLLKYLRFQAELSNAPLTVCKIGSEFPLCIVIRQTVLPQIQSRLAADQLSVHGLIEASPSLVISERELVEAGFDAAQFRNLNTQEDYWQAR